MGIRPYAFIASNYEINRYSAKTFSTNCGTVNSAIFYFLKRRGKGSKLLKHPIAQNELKQVKGSKIALKRDGPFLKNANSNGATRKKDHVHLYSKCLNTGKQYGTGTILYILIFCHILLQK